jgi:hypothetical protein
MKKNQNYLIIDEYQLDFHEISDETQFMFRCIFKQCI